MDAQERRIHELDERTIERIAAGEVVERPASVVKELLENSLDADASRVTVTVTGDGTELLRVSDDGHGMDEADAKRAVEKHTTSKIDDITDLEAGIRTLGFRGEALHAIGAVSRTTITTKAQGGTRGTEIRIEGGERTHAEPAGCPHGTTVEVTDLFYNVPARRKYLKQERTEFDHIQRIVTGYALANPEVSITLEHDGRELFSTSGRGDLRGTVLAVYGREVASAMIDVEHCTEELPEGPLTAVEGLVSHPETNRASRDYCTTFVNGRYVTARSVREAIIEAYGSQLASDRYPFAVVTVTLDPEAVDVNVHPRKLEVRFVDDTRATAQVTHAVEAALQEAGLLRSSAPRGRSAPEQTEITPESDATTQRTETTSDLDSHHEGRIDEPVRGTSETDTGSSSEQAISAADRQQGHSPDEQEPTPAPDKSSDTTPATGDSDTGSETRQSPRLRGPTTQSQLTDQGAVDQESTDRLPFDPEQLPPLTVLGQLHETYIVAETESGLVLIDQHAADERINYERLRATFDDEMAVQALAQPVELELTAREAELFEAHADALAQLGFHASLLDDRIAQVRTVPELLAESVGPELVRDLLTAFVTDDGANTVEAAADELLADLACYPSITANTSLMEGSVVDLLRALDACENPYACPHGRPVIIEINEQELEERFERDYPGHDGRRT
ncbi:DNA mismatch repair endonuclease MutL [Halocatena pleomorpha]|uniref:DNA mismatch repair protein MutL n=1 Tax=Halocatena pleomorpha TaxID=1785090 RepID=A0A3P3RAP0_9EURY|nr:DNA mismatch repair endonuclease MutL [Halocatena pleomorpha]RRJ30464.1 DNA mismatch repair endonuclease MutL [Halocatena pleomorpha]